MKLSDLDFFYPEELIGLSPSDQPRVMWVDQAGPQEISLQDLLSRIPTGDALVINNTQVLKRRIFAGDLEILFLSSEDRQRWQVLFPSKKYKVGDLIQLPQGVTAQLVEKGRPQWILCDQPLTDLYFAENGEMPLPPYIQKARNKRHNQKEDESWYQTDWATQPGSFAAPTASLHFSKEQLQSLKDKNVELIEVTLHVGLGTFLPVTAEDLSEHVMHSEYYEIKKSAWDRLQKVKSLGGKVWSLGTTSTRALESAAATPEPTLFGETQLLIQPGYQWKVVDRLLTNFHQPQSTLLALVSAFSDLNQVKACYQWAIERKFRLFSYGDLTVWIK